MQKKVRRFEKDHKNKKETKAVRTELDALHQEIKEAEYFFPISTGSRSGFLTQGMRM